ncbi:MAG: hypothetical protein AAGD00_00430 [Planctomycetota bacterium]
MDRRTPLLLALVSLLPMGLGGCGVRVKGAGATPVTRGAPAGVFMPAELVVHPLTRFETGADGRRELVLHLEMLDAWGHGTKGLGALLVELRERAGGRQLLRWNSDALVEPDSNARYYDRVTRTYRVRLVAERVTPIERDLLSVRVRLALVSGRELEASGDLVLESE